MNIKYDNEDYSVFLGDDGTLDTIIEVNRTELRYDSLEVRNDDGSIPNFLFYRAIEDYLDDKEIIT